MSEEKQNPLININAGNLGNFAEPLDTFIKKCSDAVGGLAYPWQKKRKATADAKAKIITAQADKETSIIRARGNTEIADINMRIKHRREKEDIRHQENMESILRKAIPHLKEDANAENMNDDWLINFFNKSRNFSEQEMQEIWARILAGEANTPGVFSRRTVNFVEDMSQIDAELFSNLCQFCFYLNGNYIPLIFDYRNNIYEKENITLNSLLHLRSIGLINFDDTGGHYAITHNKKLWLPIIYQNLSGNNNNTVLLIMRKESDNILITGQVNLTNLGQELFPICDREIVPGFLDYMKEQWKEHLPTYEEQKFFPQLPPEIPTE